MFLHVFLAILEKVCFIIQFCLFNSTIHPIWSVLIKLLGDYLRIMLNCLLTEFKIVNSCLVDIKQHLAGTQVLNLLIKISNTFRANRVFCVAMKGIYVVTRMQNKFYTSVCIILISAKKLVGIFIVPINTKHASIRVAFYVFKKLSLKLFYWVKLFIFFICALVIWQNLLK